MEKFANALADGLRANGEIDAYNDMKNMQPTVHGDDPTSFSRRMDKRNTTKKSYIDESAKQVDGESHDIEDAYYQDEVKDFQVESETQFYTTYHHPQRLSAITEVDDYLESDAYRRSTTLSVATGPMSASQQWLDGSEATPRNIQYAGTNKPMMSMQRSESMPLVPAPKLEQHTTRSDSLPLIQIIDVTEELEDHPLDIEVLQPNTLKNVTAKTRKIIRQAGAADKRFKKAVKRAQKKSKFIEHGLSPGNRRIDDHSRTVTTGHGPSSINRLLLRVPSTENLLRSPVKALSPRKFIKLRPDEKALMIDRQRFSLIKTKTITVTSDQPSTVPSIPPRSSSLNYIPRDLSKLFASYQTILPKTTPRLETLPLQIGNKIWRMLVVADHKLLICCCGIDACSAVSGQPAITHVNRKLRSEALPIFYGENKFIIHSSKPYTWKLFAPAWLRALTLDSRTMLRHVEISTTDLASVVAMMATFDLKLKCQLPSKQHVDLVDDAPRQGIMLTFTANYPKPTPEEMAERDADDSPPTKSNRISTVSSCDLWDGDEGQYQSTTGNANESNVNPRFSQYAESAASVSTGILDPTRYTDEILKKGHQARTSRGRVAMPPDQSTHVGAGNGGARPQRLNHARPSIGRTVTFSENEGIRSQRASYAQVDGVLDDTTEAFTENAGIRSQRASYTDIDTTLDGTTKATTPDKEALATKINDFMVREERRYPGQRATMKSAFRTASVGSYSIGADLISAVTPDYRGQPPEVQQQKRERRLRRMDRTKTIDARDRFEASWDVVDFGFARLT